MSTKVLYFFFLMFFFLGLIYLMAIKTHESGAQVIRASSVIHWGEILARQRSRQVHCFSFNSDEVMGLLVLGSWKL